MCRSPPELNWRWIGYPAVYQYSRPEILPIFHRQMMTYSKNIHIYNVEESNEIDRSYVNTLANDKIRAHKLT